MKESATPRRTLVVANLTAATPLLMKEVERRVRERPAKFALLIPSVRSTAHADWTMERAIERLERAARGPVAGIVGGEDPFESVKRALEGGHFDEVLISTLSRRTSEWLRRDLPRRVERLGVPVTVISQREEDEQGKRDARRRAAEMLAGGSGS
jgi:hypothetical protein